MSIVLRQGLIAASLAVALLPLCTRADDETAKKEFRVCRDPNNLPFANAKGEGFEDRIAKLLADDAGAQLSFYDFASRMNFVRNTLKFKLPSEDYHCDVMMGVATGFDQVAQTRAYYRSTYALVIPQGRKLDGVKTVDDLFAMPASATRDLHIGVVDRSPASEWLVKHGLLEQGVPYKLLIADVDKTSPGIMEADLVAGKIDAAVVWGPIAGYMVRSAPDLKMLVLPLASEPGVKFDFDIAMGLRYGEKDRKQELEALLDRNQAKIDAVLAEYRIPTLPPSPTKSDKDGK